MQDRTADLMQEELRNACSCCRKCGVTVPCGGVNGAFGGDPESCEGRCVCGVEDEPEAWLILHVNGPSWEALWWSPKRSGYTMDLSKAGRYSREEAEAQERDRSSDRAVPESLAVQLSRPTVDRDTLLAKLHVFREAGDAG